MKQINLEIVHSLYEKYQVYPNIREHMKKVALLAREISIQINHAILLRKNGNLYKYQLDVDFIYYSALLHDIAKAYCLEQRKKNIFTSHHNIVGYDILVKEGYPEMAELVKSHTSDVIEEQDGETKWLKQGFDHKLLSLCDGHVLNDKIVSLDERMSYLVKAYPDDVNKLSKLYVLWNGLKIEIASILGYDIFLKFIDEDKALK